MLKRVISAVILIIIALAALLLGGIWLGAVVFIFAGISMYEFYSAFKQKGFHPLWPLGFLYLGLIPVVVFMEPSHALEIPVNGTNIFPAIQLIIMLAMLSVIVIRHNKYNIVDCAITLIGAFYVPFLYSFFILLRNREDGMMYLAVGVLGTVMADTFAMFGGMLFGKKKLVPELSPKKTVAGSIGSFVGSAVSVILLGWLMNRLHIMATPLSIVHYIILGLLLGLTSQIGDLSASAMKRYCGIKDFGKIIPGHGGILDRMDSMLFNVPLIYCYIQIVSALRL